MQIILEPYTIPERGTFLIHETITIRVTVEEARRQVNRWLLDEVSLQMGAEESALVVGEVSVWRVPVRWGAPSVGHVGIVGMVDVDLISGEMDNSEPSRAELIQRAQEFAAQLPLFQLREAPPEFLATHLKPTHKPGRPSGNPHDLLSR